MIPILLSMIGGACFLAAGLIHKQRGELVDARKCAVMVVISLVLLAISVAVDLA